MAHHEFNYRTSGDIVKAADDHGKRYKARYMPLLLKVHCEAPFSAFRFSSDPPLYATTAHGIPDGATTLDAVDMLGRTAAVYVRCVHSGIDLAILEASPELEVGDGPKISFAQTDEGSTVYLFGFSGDKQRAHFTTGYITSMRPGLYTTTADTDPGFCGGPAVNVRGEVVGIVKRTDKLTQLISADRLLAFVELSDLQLV